MIEPDPIAELLGQIVAELYRIRVALEVLAGEALDRELDKEAAAVAYDRGECDG